MFDSFFIIIFCLGKCKLQVAFGPNAYLNFGIFGDLFIFLLFTSALIKRLQNVSSFESLFLKRSEKFFLIFLLNFFLQYLVLNSHCKML